MVAVYLPWASFVGKRSSANLTALVLPQEAPLSAAQRCNEDVLDEIFAELQPGSLASAALVCRGWLFPARVRLYRELQADTMFVHKRNELLRTLSTQPHILRLVRRPVLRWVYDPAPCAAFFDWVALLPEHSLQSVEIVTIDSRPRDPLDTLDTLLGFPAIHSLTRIIIRCDTGFLTPKRLNQVLEMPHLQSLSVRISHPTAVHLTDITAFPNLKRLSILADVYTPLIAKLLHGLPSPLERFDLGADDIEDTDIATLCHSLQRHAPHLRNLSFLGEPFSKSHLCFMDDFVSSFSSLETLSCAHYLYSPLIFSRLPPTLVSLSLCTPSRWEGSIPWTPHAVALQQHRSKLPLLRRVTIVNCEYTVLNLDPLPEVCEAGNITFRQQIVRFVDVLK